MTVAHTVTVRAEAMTWELTVKGGYLIVDVGWVITIIAAMSTGIVVVTKGMAVVTHRAWYVWRVSDVFEVFDLGCE